MSSVMPERAHGTSRPELGLESVDVGDEFEQELLEVSALLASTVVRRRDRMHQGATVDVIEGQDTAVDTAAQLVSDATTRVDVVLAAEPGYSRAVHQALTVLLAADGHEELTVRLLCTPATLDWRFVSGHVGEPRVETRVARIPALAAVIADHERALVCADSAVGRRASVIRSGGVIRPLLALFDGVWRNAVVVSDRIDFGDKGRTEIAQQILERLRAGVTDDVAARELAMSVRTYRRYVAEIMALLGATSRFQAGVRAAELGLLLSQSPGSRR
ncbi:helix-turn-helix transcriptional regulator [Streptomyces sp. NEAU-Y11]|uniref:helix-turn-helix transcriptional regulator n=1 Tax=Streptomyces cucumeris TaxID=2962890 RepID=UPI0020C93871|nr:LuxR family transcriptional regulator [Streptomyces sp. NEAU-Y11]MCP9206869.1 LuxR family transcriptional regulator [Streptomyces sp. NEAU-Y11]